MFADGACELWDSLSCVPRLPVDTDVGCSLTVRLRQMLCISNGVVKKVLGAVAALAPHSMQTERIVSHHNIIGDDRRTCMSTETINARLTIALNGVGTAHYDPRPAVVRFLSMKPRRGGESDTTHYAQRDFAKKFFRQSIADDIGQLDLLSETV